MKMVFLQTRKILPKTKTVPREWAKVVERIKEVDKEIASTRDLMATKDEVSSVGAEARTEIRGSGRDASQPILEKETVRSSSNNPLYHLGKLIHHKRLLYHDLIY